MWSSDLRSDDEGGITAGNLMQRYVAQQPRDIDEYWVHTSVKFYLGARLDDLSIFHFFWHRFVEGATTFLE